MKKSIALIAVMLLGLSYTYAQTAPDNSPQPALHHAPGTSSSAAPQSSTQSGSGASTAPAGKPAENVPPDEEKAIRRLMALLGTDKIAESFNQSLNVQLREAMHGRGMADDRLKQFLQDFGQNFATQSVDAKVNAALIQVFAENLSAEDINGLVQFYESPLGNRFMNALPAISQSSQQQGSTIVRDQAILTLRKMTDQYPEVKTLLPPDSSNPSSEQGPPVRSIPDATPHLDQPPSSAPQNP
jgi:uncharacterized protein